MMNTIFAVGWILAVGAALVILYIANDYLGKREHSDAPFTGEEDIQAQIDMFIWEQNK